MYLNSSQIVIFCIAHASMVQNYSTKC